MTHWRIEGDVHELVDDELPRFRTIVADPPWPFEWDGGGAYRKNGRGERHLNRKFKKGLEYPTMSIEDIARLPVADIAEPDAHLYLWIPDCHLIEGHAAAVCRAWGFEPGRTLIWHKTGFGLGRFPRPQHEAVLICRRGRAPFEVANVGSVVQWPFTYENGARVHSRKPDGFLELVERASPGPYLELFARRRRDGWAAWGNEVECDVDVDAYRGARLFDLIGPERSEGPPLAPCRPAPALKVVGADHAHDTPARCGLFDLPEPVRRRLRRGLNGRTAG